MPRPYAPDAFEARLGDYLYERSEEARAVRVGEKETSEQAAVVARYADLFTREQHAVLREAEEGADGGDRERLFRLREACAGGVIVAELAERADALENAILACRVELRGEAMPLRAAQARLAVLEGYGERDRLGGLVVEASASFNGDRLELLRAGEETRSCRASPTPCAAARSSRGSSSSDSPRPWRRPPRGSTRPTPGCVSAGSTGSSGPTGRTSPSRPTSPTCAASRRSPAPTRRSGPCRCASPRWPRSTSTSPHRGHGHRGHPSASTSTTGRRRARAPASSPPTRPGSST